MGLQGVGGWCLLGSQNCYASCRATKQSPCGGTGSHRFSARLERRSWTEGWRSAPGKSRLTPWSRSKSHPRWTKVKNGGIACSKDSANPARQLDFQESEKEQVGKGASEFNSTKVVLGVGDAAFKQDWGTPLGPGGTARWPAKLPGYERWPMLGQRQTGSSSLSDSTTVKCLARLTVHTSIKTHCQTCSS